MSEKQDSYRSEQNRLLSPWGYVGYGLLFSIPVIGWILSIVFALNNDNLNRRNFARAYWCWVLVGVVVAVVLMILGVTVGLPMVETFSTYWRY